MRLQNFLALGAIFLAISGTAKADVSLDFDLNPPSSGTVNGQRELSAGEMFDVDILFDFNNDNNDNTDFTMFEFDVVLPTDVVEFVSVTFDNNVRPDGFQQNAPPTFDMASGSVIGFEISEDPDTPGGQAVTPPQNFVVGTISLTALVASGSPLQGDLTFTNLTTDRLGGASAVQSGTATLTVAAVPEPSSFAAIMLAVGVISARRRRQNL